MSNILENISILIYLKSYPKPLIPSTGSFISKVLHLTNGGGVEPTLINLYLYYSYIN